MEVLQTASLLVGLFTAAYTIRTNTVERKIGNLFELTKAHREIWSRLYDQNELERVLMETVNLRDEPVSVEEELFVHTLILHLRQKGSVIACRQIYVSRHRFKIRLC